MAITNINSNEFAEMLRDDPESLEIIDVREPYEHEKIRIKGSKLIPLSIIPLKANEIDWGKKVILVCRSGARSLSVAQLLSSVGKNVFNLQGGVEGLSRMDCPCLQKS